MLVTSREFPEIESIRGFESFQTRPLKIKEAISILKKLDYDEQVRDALIDLIENESSRKHDYFLQNPLMVTIMLLTFDQSKDIPTKRSALYRRAFEALYERHDASKGIFKRDHHAGLPMDEFEKIFSTFCFGTYTNGLSDFPETQLVPLFREACTIANIDENPEDIARDASESACLIVKEGHDFVFCHRTFQEYFTAVYLRDYRGEDISQLYDLAMSRGQGENVIEFIYEMDKHAFEVHYVIPRLKNIVASISKSMKNGDDSLAIMRHFFSEIHLIEPDLRFAGWEVANTDDTIFLFNMALIYPEVGLVEAFLEVDDGPVRFHDIFIGKAKSTRSYNRKEKNDRTVSVLKFSPSANAWLRDSVLDKKISSFFSDLRRLYERLCDSYSKERENTISARFKGFSRN